MNDRRISARLHLVDFTRGFLFLFSFQSTSLHGNVCFHFFLEKGKVFVTKEIQGPGFFDFSFPFFFFLRTRNTAKEKQIPNVTGVPVVPDLSPDPQGPVHHGEKKVFKWQPRELSRNR